MTKIEKEIQRIFEKHGCVTASMVLEEAQEKSSPLHDSFVWDDSLAAQEYRLNQARQLIRKVRIEYEGTSQRLVHVPKIITATDTSKEGYYKPIRAIINQPTEFEAALSEALSKLGTARSAVEYLQEFARGSDDQRIPKISIALRALSVAKEAVASFH